MAEHAALQQTLARLRRVGAIPNAAPALKASMPGAARSLRRAIIADVPALAASANPQIRIERDEHAAEHLREIHRLFSGGAIGNFEFVRAHARRRAEQRHPLESTLHAYRCGHQVLSRWIRAAASAVRSKGMEKTVTAAADFSIAYTNEISATMTAEYVAHTRQLAEVEGDRRTDMLNALLAGHDEFDERVAQLLKPAGYLEPRQSFCVALVRSTDPLEMRNHARAQRIVEAVIAAVAPLKIRALVGIRNSIVTAVFSDSRRQSGWTALRTSIIDRLQPVLLVLGPAVLVGVSREHPSVAALPKALHEATIALDCASVGERVVQFPSLPLRRLLLHRSRDYLRSVLPPWAGEFADADAKVSGALAKSLRAYADADMNVIRAARLLRVHPNTLYARLQRVKILTGLNGQRYHDLIELLLAVDCLQPK